MNYGDIVTYVHPHEKTEVNALVYSHDLKTDAATLLLLHPKDDSQGLKPVVPTVLHGVGRLGGNAVIGWRPTDNIDGRLVDKMAADIAAEREEFHAKIDELQTTNTCLNEQIAQLKSADILDAAEQVTAESIAADDVVSAETATAEVEVQQ